VQNAVSWRLPTARRAQTSLVHSLRRAVRRVILDTRSRTTTPLASVRHQHYSILLLGCYYHGSYCYKGKGLDTCYSAAYISQTRDQQRFTISEVAADWHEPMVLQVVHYPR